MSDKFLNEVTTVSIQGPYTIVSIERVLIQTHIRLLWFDLLIEIEVWIIICIWVAACLSIDLSKYIHNV